MPVTTTTGLYTTRTPRVSAAQLSAVQAYFGKPSAAASSKKFAFASFKNEGYPTTPAATMGSAKKGMEILEEDEGEEEEEKAVAEEMGKWKEEEKSKPPGPRIRPGAFHRDIITRTFSHTRTLPSLTEDLALTTFSDSPDAEVEVDGETTYSVSTTSTPSLSPMTSRTTSSASLPSLASLPELELDGCAVVGALEALEEDLEEVDEEGAFRVAKVAVAKPVAVATVGEVEEKMEEVEMPEGWRTPIKDVIEGKGRFQVEAVVHVEGGRVEIGIDSHIIPSPPTSNSSSTELLTTLSLRVLSGEISLNGVAFSQTGSEDSEVCLLKVDGQVVEKDEGGKTVIIPGVEIACTEGRWGDEYKVVVKSVVAGNVGPKIGFMIEFAAPDAKDATKTQSHRLKLTTTLPALAHPSAPALTTTAYLSLPSSEFFIRCQSEPLPLELAILSTKEQVGWGKAQGWKCGSEMKGMGREDVEGLEEVGERIGWWGAEVKVEAEVEVEDKEEFEEMVVEVSVEEAEVKKEVSLLPVATTESDLALYFSALLWLLACLFLQVLLPACMFEEE